MEKFYILFFGLICLIGLLGVSYMLLKVLYLKLVCTKSVEATITDMILVRGYRGFKKYYPILTYTYNDVTYNTKAMDGYIYGPNVLEERMGTKMIIKIDDNDPSNIYTNFGWQAFLFIMLFVLCLTLLIAVCFLYINVL